MIVLKKKKPVQEEPTPIVTVSASTGKRVMVYKKITMGADIWGQTDAVGDLERVKKTGIMPCGSGDDHCLLARERQMVENHNPADGDLTLPPGHLGRRMTKRPVS